MPLRGLRGAIFGSLGTLLRFTLINLATFRDAVRSIPTTAARPDPGPSQSHRSPYLNERRHHAIARPTNARDAILRYVPRLVRRGHDGPPRLSGQALAVIVLCATIVLCALLGCLMQLPAMCPCLRRTRGLRSDGGGTTTPTRSSHGSSSRSSSSGGFGFFDVEMMGDRAESLASTSGVSPPPPYSRAPSYESAGSTTGGRRECTS